MERKGRGLNGRILLFGGGVFLTSAVVIGLLTEKDIPLTQIPTQTPEPQPIASPNLNQNVVSDIVIAENVSNVSAVNPNTSVNNLAQNTNIVYESVQSTNSKVQCVKLGSWTSDNNQTVFSAFKSLGQPNDFNDVKRGGVFVNGKFVAFITPDLLTGSHALDNVPVGTVICGDLTPEVQGS